MPVPKQQFLSNNGILLVGGKVYTYAAGGNIPKATYTDVAGTIAQTNPIILNARGEPASAIFWSGSYRVELRDSLDNLIYTVDNYNTDPFGLSTVASGIYAAFAAPGGSALVGFMQSGTGAVPRTQQEKDRDTVNVEDFGAVGDWDGTNGTDDTAAFQAALNTGKLVKADGRAFKIMAPLTMTPGGGFEGDGENTRLVRGFNGGPVLRHPGGASLGQPIILRDFSVITASTIIPVDGDTGIDIGYAATWSGRGDISNILILSQWDGFKWKGGTQNPIYSVQVQECSNHGFYGVNPRGELIDCLSQFNKGSGYCVLATNPGETGVRLIHCGTFCNQEFGLLIDTTGGVTGANVWLDNFSSSYDGRGGIYCDKLYTQLRFNNTFVEYAGFSTQFKPGFTSYLSAVGITLNNAGINYVQMSGITQCNHCKGSGMVLSGVVDCTIQELICYDNGRGLQGGASQNGFNIQNSCTRLRVNGFSYGSSSASQLFDIAINTTNNTGDLSNVRAINIYSVDQVGLVWKQPATGVVQPAVTAASTTTLPGWGSLITVNGTTNIDAISPSWRDRVVYLRFSNSLTVFDGNNLILAGNFVATVSDVLTLVCDGTNWYEVARAAN